MNTATKSAIVGATFLVCSSVFVVLASMTTGVQGLKPSTYTANPEAEVRHEMCDSQVGDRMAYDNAQDQVLKLLKAPPTAKFPDFSEVTVVRHPDCSFDVSGYVDAQNGFGAMIRSTWTDKVVYAGHDAKGYHHSVARALID